MLKQRVITALALVAALLCALAWSPLAFAGLLTLGFSLAQAEWLRLSGWSFRTSLLVALTLGGAQFALFAAAPATVAAIGPAAVAVATAIWIGLGVVLLRSEKKGAVRIPAATSRALAIVLPFAAWCALMMFLQLGAVMLLSVLVIIWLADIAAYFVGRAFGRRKLAPHISPGKTWAGVWGAIGGVVVAALIAWAGFPDAPLYTNRLLEGLGIRGQVFLPYPRELLLALVFFDNQLEHLLHDDAVQVVQVGPVLGMADEVAKLLLGDVQGRATEEEKGLLLLDREETVQGLAEPLGQ